MPPKLGIIAGGGNLPRRIIATCRAEGRPFFVLAFRGHTPPESVEGVPHEWIRLGAGGTGLKILRREGVEELVLAGAVRRPSLAELKPDLWTAKFLARVGPMALGDDGLLGAVVRQLETGEGFRVIGAESLVPQVLAPEGVLGRVEPDDQALGDVARGVEVAKGICALDVGQAAVVQQGLVLAVEAIEGTDAMVARAAELRRDGPGGVLVKVGQPKRESRADLPAVGENTVTAAQRAGLRGIAVEAGGALLIDRERLVAAADAAGLFLLGVQV
jgi:hypothetical protein